MRWENEHLTRSICIRIPLGGNHARSQWRRHRKTRYLRSRRPDTRNPYADRRYSLLGYGSSLNLAPVEFRHVVGLYIATLFIVWQIINFIFFRTLPNLPIIVGGTLIIIGGMVVTFWKPAYSP